MFWLIGRKVLLIDETTVRRHRRRILSPCSLSGQRNCAKNGASYPPILKNEERTQQVVCHQQIARGTNPNDLREAAITTAWRAPLGQMGRTAENGSTQVNCCTLSILRRRGVHHLLARSRQSQPADRTTCHPASFVGYPFPWEEASFRFSPSPLGRGWPGAGAFTCRRGSGEGPFVLPADFDATQRNGGV